MTDVPDSGFSSFVIDNQNNERPPWKVCGTIERSLLIWVTHFLLLVSLISCCFVYLFINNFAHEATSHVWPVITFCIGCLIPTP